MGTRRILLAGALTIGSFTAGFAASRYVLDRSLHQAETVLLRSAQEFEAQQAFLFEQSRAALARLRARIDAHSLEKEERHR